MTDKCIHHPGRKATVGINNKKYCLKCEQGQQNAAKNVDRHVDPKGCFVWYLGGDRWSPIKGTGCAHFVAHQKKIKKGLASHRCLEGLSIKVADIYKGKIEIKSLDNVRVGDIYVNSPKTHCGIVSRIRTVKVKPLQRKITIKHASIRQGRVAENDFDTYFKGKGSFFR